MVSENSRNKQLTSFKDPFLQYIIMFILFLFAIENILPSLRYKLSFNMGYIDSDCACGLNIVYAFQNLYLGTYLL